MERAAAGGGLKAVPGMGSLISDLDLLVMKPMFVVEQDGAGGHAHHFANAPRCPLVGKQIGRRQERNPRAGRRGEQTLGADDIIIAFGKDFAPIRADYFQDSLGRQQQPRRADASIGIGQKKALSP